MTNHVVDVRPHFISPLISTPLLMLRIVSHKGITGSGDPTEENWGRFWQLMPQVLGAEHFTTLYSVPDSWSGPSCGPVSRDQRSVHPLTKTESACYPGLCLILFYGTEAPIRFSGKLGGWKPDEILNFSMASIWTSDGLISRISSYFSARSSGVSRSMQKSYVGSRASSPLNNWSVSLG